LIKFHGVPESTFYLHLKECEFRFNYRDKDLYKMLLKMFRKYPLF
jgi:transposase-like protein